jgi:hypothetical protein
VVAIAHFNARNASVMPAMADLARRASMAVTPLLYDTRYTNRGALSAANDALQSGADTVLGTARSTSTASTVQLSYLFDAPMLSYWASSPVLSDPSRSHCSVAPMPLTKL